MLNVPELYPVFKSTDRGRIAQYSKALHHYGVPHIKTRYAIKIDPIVATGVSYNKLIKLELMGFPIGKFQGVQ